MQTCETCRHWERYSADAFYIAMRGRGQCMAVAQDERGAARALILSAEEAEFVTAPDFGCVLHEPKPGTEA